MDRPSHPDDWGEGLWFNAKTLSIKTIARARTPEEVLGVCLSHNLRRNNESHRHRSHIDQARTALNEVLRGPTCPLVGAALARDMLLEQGLAPVRRDSIMGIELVMQAPTGGDVPEFWEACLQWAGARYEHIVSAVVHRDQKRPHLHVLAAAVTDGRMCGNEMTAGPNRFVMQKRDFMAYMRAALGLRPDRAQKTLADFAVRAGKGPKTKEQADRNDAAYTRAVATRKRLQSKCRCEQAELRPPAIEAGALIVDALETATSPMTVFDCIVDQVVDAMAGVSLDSKQGMIDPDALRRALRGA